MKYLTRLIQILVVVTLMACIPVSAVRADVLPRGEAPTDYCFQIANLWKYPNYVLVAQIRSENGGLPTYNRILKSDRCLGLNGYREYSEVYAIAKARIQDGDIIETETGQALQDFESKKYFLIPAKEPIIAVRTFPEQYQVTEVADILEIVAIDRKSLKLRFRHAEYTYEGGYSEIIDYISPDKRPFPSTRNTSTIFNLFVSAIAVASMVLIYKNFRILKP